jgi:hypothetical protein
MTPIIRRHMRPAKEQEIDIFARWFGVILRDLRDNHDLRLKQHSHKRKAYAHESQITHVTHIR